MFHLILSLVPFIERVIFQVQSHDPQLFPRFRRPYTDFHWSQYSRHLSGHCSAHKAPKLWKMDCSICRKDTSHHRFISKSLYFLGPQASYLSMARNESSGFQNLACQFSLPRALLLWALGIFSIQVPFLFADMTDRSMLVILGSVSALYLICWIFHMLLTRCWSLVRNARHWNIFRSRSIQLEDTLPY